MNMLWVSERVKAMIRKLNCKCLYLLRLYSQVCTEYKAYTPKNPDGCHYLITLSTFSLPAAGLSTSSIAGAMWPLTAPPHPRPLIFISLPMFSFPITTAVSVTAA